MSIIDDIEIFNPIKYTNGLVTIIDCNDSFTHNLVDAFLRLGKKVSVIKTRFCSKVENLDEIIGDYLVISPGPGNPEDFKEVIKIFKYYIGKLPILGVCMGMQIINYALGGYTINANEIYHGKTSNIFHDNEGIFNNVKNPTKVARYHSLMIEPSDEVNVKSSYKGIIMAICVPNKQITGVQFHPESFMTEEGEKMLQNFLENRIK